MKPVHAIVAAVLTLAGCTPRDRERQPAAPASEPPPQTVVYACEGGRPAEAGYAADGSLVLTIGDETWPMNPAEAVSGSRWTGAQLEWWVTLERGQEVGVLRGLGPDGVGEAEVARCVRPTGGGVLAPEPPDLAAAGVAAPANPCVTSQLSLAVVSQEGAAGSRYTVLAFENAGTARCSLQGYPQLSLIGSDGRPLADMSVNHDRGASGNATGSIEPVALEPGGRAYFDLVSTAVAGEVAGESEPCAPVIAVRAAPPNDQSAVQAPLELSPCNGRVRITPFRPTEDPNRAG